MKKIDLHWPVGAAHRDLDVVKTVIPSPHPPYPPTLGVEWHTMWF